MHKQIKLDNDNVIDISITDGYTQMITISRFYRIGEKIKNIRFSIWDDIAFRAYTSENQTDTLEFSFTIHDPLYFCLNRFLASDKELVIDDDDTYGNMNKYMIIKKEDFIIKIIFKNILSENDYYIEDKFRIFIKNIGPDPRSKIDDYSFKCRIINFLRDLETTILEEYHQITIDEYLEKLNYYQECENQKQKKLI